MRIVSKTLISVFAAFSLAGAATASDWQVLDGQDPAAPSLIYAETETGAALLGCQMDGKLIASVSDQAQDFQKRIRQRITYKRGADVDLKIGARDEISAEWMLIPASRTIVAPSYGQAAKIFNAVVRQDAITFTVDRSPYVTLTLPASDAIFSAFAQTCKTKRDMHK